MQKSSDHIHKYISKIRPVHVFLFFVTVHLFLFGINAAEWGDSYRILRAAEFLRDAKWVDESGTLGEPEAVFNYPQDEKRPPLFSVILALRPQAAEQVFWGRVVMFGFSLGAFYIYYRLLRLLFGRDELKITLALLLFALNPVFLYWSLRVMADVPLAFFALLAIYVLTLVREQPKQKITKTYLTKALRLWPVILGFIVGLSVLLRFEGYIIFGAVGLGILYLDGFSSVDRFFANSITGLKKHFWQLFWYVLVFLLTILPWVLYRNPLTSSYFGEQTGRTFSFDTVVIFALSAVFLFGFTFAGYFYVQNWRGILTFSQKNVGIAVLVLAELLLILWWPAAIPRLFTITVPFLTIFLADSVVGYFTRGSIFKTKYLDLLFLGGVLGFYILGQYYYKLQFLVLLKPVFMLVVILAVVQIYFIYKVLFSKFLVALVVSMVLWVGATIYIHKDIYRTIKEAAIYAATTVSGPLAHNDGESVAEWYLNYYNSGDDRVADKLVDVSDVELVDKEDFERLGVRYMLITSEPNPDFELEINIEEVNRLATFKHYINGAFFYSEVLEVSP